MVERAAFLYAADMFLPLLAPRNVGRLYQKIRELSLLQALRLVGAE